MILYAICAIIVSVLSIILFFKVWGMTNDVKEIKERLANVLLTEKEKKHVELQKAALASGEDNTDIVASEFKVGETVRYAPMNRIMVVKSIQKDGDIECVSYKKNGNEEFEGVYKPSQIEHYGQ